MSDSRPTVWITGLGTISCLGRDVGETWDNVLSHRSAIRDGLGRVPPEFLDGDTSNRALAFAMKAAREAMSSAGWGDRLGSEDGLILATTTGFFLQWDEAFKEFTLGRLDREAFHEKFLNQPLSELSDAVSGELFHSGPKSLVTSACSAATQALGLGAMWIRQGRVKRCLVLGVEVLCDLTREGFKSLQLLSAEASRPFDQNRRGINLSEGAGAICLEADAHPGHRLAALSGFGFSTDGFHMTGPHPEGDGSFRAMSQAIEVARLEPAKISWMHAHGTGSRQNDLAEGLAAARLFGENGPWLSSTKWLHGHALGAAGALESVLVLKAMTENKILGTRGLETPDPEIPGRLLGQDVDTEIDHVMKNTLGFGGTNAAVVFSHPRTVSP